MSTKSEGDGDDRGCTLIIGLVIIASVIGNTYTAEMGWLVFGIGLFIAAIL